MAIPIKIYAVDNARDWDYYPPTGAGSAGADGNWTWNKSTIIRGKDAHNYRWFKTSLPVYGSSLDIRIIDKTMKNKENK